MAQLDARDRARLVILAYRARLLRPDEVSRDELLRQTDDGGIAGAQDEQVSSRLARFIERLTA